MHLHPHSAIFIDIHRGQRTICCPEDRPGKPFALNNFVKGPQLHGAAQPLPAAASFTTFRARIAGASRRSSALLLTKGARGHFEVESIKQASAHFRGRQWGQHCHAKPQGITTRGTKTRRQAWIVHAAGTVVADSASRRIASTMPQNWHRRYWR